MGCFLYMVVLLVRYLPPPFFLFFARGPFLGLPWLCLPSLLCASLPRCRLACRLAGPAHAGSAVAHVYLSSVGVCWRCGVCPSACRRRRFDCVHGGTAPAVPCVALLLAGPSWACLCSARFFACVCSRASLG